MWRRPPTAPLQSNGNARPPRPTHHAHSHTPMASRCPCMGTRVAMDQHYMPSHTTRLAPPMAADGLRWPPNGRAPPNPSVCLQILLITVRHQFLHWPGTLYHELTQSCLPAVVRVWQSQSSQLPPPPRLALGSIAAAGVGESTVEALLCRGCSLLRRSRVAAVGR